MDLHHLYGSTSSQEQHECEAPDKIILGISQEPHVLILGIFLVSLWSYD